MMQMFVSWIEQASLFRSTILRLWDRNGKLKKYAQEGKKRRMQKGLDLAIAQDTPPPHALFIMGKFILLRKSILVPTLHLS